MNTLGARLSQILLDHKLTMHQFGEILGVTRGAVSQWVKNQTKPTPKTLLAILDAFPDISCTWLLRGVGSMKQSDELAGQGKHPEQEVVQYLRKELEYCYKLIKQYEKIIEHLPEKTDDPII